jgi:NADH:ubiquinone oxidoreductase subunit E
MTVGERSKEEVVSAVRAAVERHGSTKGETIPVLNEVNQAVGYLSKDALAEISRALRVPLSELYSIATFYQMLNTKPRGAHVIKFCESAPCHVVGGRLVWQSLQDTLELKPGETSQDGKWTLMTTSCLGVCGVGPVIIIDEDIYGNVSPEQVPEILARYA